jgi:hypothetical protein
VKHRIVVLFVLLLAVTACTSQQDKECTAMGDMAFDIMAQRLNGVPLMDAMADNTAGRSDTMEFVAQLVLYAYDVQASPEEFRDNITAMCYDQRSGRSFDATHYLGGQ